jgi:putative Mg2+ transporter-C (MgtC) family protein
VIALHADLLLRILVGTVFGAVIGYERRMHGRPAGLRTHLIVALAASTFMVVSTHFVYFQTYRAGDLVAVDPSRIAASVVTGVGFLGGGAILRTGVNVQGLTTAAGLWLVAAIGLSAGAGMYVVSTFSTLLGVVALTVLRRLEHKDPPLSAILAALQARKMVVSPAPYEKRVDETSMEITFQAHIPADAGEELVQILESQPGLRRVRVDVPS